MHSLRIAAMAAAAFFITAATGLAAQQSADPSARATAAESKASRVTITVVDAVDARIRGALVAIDLYTPTFQAIRTDDKGQVSIELPDGRHSLFVQAHGFCRWKSLAVVQGTDKEITAKLAVAVIVDGVRVRPAAAPVPAEPLQLIAFEPVQTIPLPMRFLRPIR
jgi:hypothetical protein